MSWYENFPPYIYVGDTEHFNGMYTWGNVNHQGRTQMMEHIRGDTFLIEAGEFGSKYFKNHFIHAQWIDVPDISAIINFCKDELQFTEMVDILRMLAKTQGIKDKYK